MVAEHVLVIYNDATVSILSRLFTVQYEAAGLRTGQDQDFGLKD